MMPHDPRRRRARLHDIQNVMDSLREPVEAPDLTDAILGRVHDERPFLSPGVRRLLWVGRAMAACVAAGAVFGIVMTRRHAPETVRMVSVVRPAPLSAVVDSLGAEASQIRFRAPSGLCFPSFPGVPEDRAADGAWPEYTGDGATPTIVYAAYTEPGPIAVESPYALAGTSFGARSGYVPNARSLARYGSFVAGGSMSLTVPLAPPRRADRNLLDDLSPVITGEPAGENLCPR
jgi:hypothetical protein